MILKRTIAALAILAAASALGACGNKSKTTTHGSTEGIYLDVGPLTYQVQVSRELNPRDLEDRTFLTGVSQSDAQVGTGELWFAVFVRVENETKRVQSPASAYSITDTQDNVYMPVPVSASVNPFAYVPARMPPGTLLPAVDTVASQTSIGGEMLLFKIKRESLDNRPLEFAITDPADPQIHGTVDLDV
jgi:hypothetical protein